MNILFNRSTITIGFALIIINFYSIKQSGASLILPDDSFKNRNECMNVINSLDNLGLLGTKYNELKGNCNHNNDLEETYHDVVRDLRTLGEIEEVVIPN